MTMALVAHVDFFVRGLLLLVIMLCRQLPQSYDVRIDKEMFLEAFSVKQGETRISPTPWPLGPEGAVHQEPDPSSPRAKVVDHFLNVFYPHTARAQPYASNEHSKPAPKNGRGTLLALIPQHVFRTDK